MIRDDTLIKHVSDTALWVSYYRSLESYESDPLFRDDLAKKLAGERGERIAHHMGSTSRYTHWNVVIRTLIIDQFVRDQVASGVDTIVNLGAGLDTRPYRMGLPKSVQWIEVDYPHMIEYKDRVLHDEVPTVSLRRISLDLSDRTERQKLFTQINRDAKKALVITEGVIIYLSEQQVAELAEDLGNQPHFQFWIAEYLSKDVYRHFQNRKRMEKMKNAPFEFFPQDWFGFFKNKGWKIHEIRYLGEEGNRVNRKMPIPLWAKIVSSFIPKNQKKKFQRQMGYAIFIK